MGMAQLLSEFKGAEWEADRRVPSPGFVDLCTLITSAHPASEKNLQHHIIKVPIVFFNRQHLHHQPLEALHQSHPAARSPVISYQPFRS